MSKNSDLTPAQQSRKYATRQLRIWTDRTLMIASVITSAMAIATAVVAFMVSLQTQAEIQRVRDEWSHKQVMDGIVTAEEMELELAAARARLAAVQVKLMKHEPGENVQPLAVEIEMIKNHLAEVFAQADGEVQQRWPELSQSFGRIEGYLIQDQVEAAAEVASLIEKMRKIV